MNSGAIIFVGCIATVLYAYTGYPAIVWMLSWFRRSRATQPTGALPPVSIIVSAHNEASRIADRLVELKQQIDCAGVVGEVILVSDGSTDRTADIARGIENVRVIEHARNIGKAACISDAASAARNEILVFADMRQTWSPDAVRCLIENFQDSRVGAVGGELIVSTAPGVMDGVGLYWRYEKWLRALESRLHSTVGLSGSICATRRELFTPIPAGTILDDVYWPMCVAMRGYRVVHEAQARAFDRLPERGADEFRRKVRTLSGNFQLVARLPRVLLPGANPIWFQFVSHKLLRLLVPWLLLTILVLSATLTGLVYQVALVAQVLGYATAHSGGRFGPSIFRRIASAGASFLLLNAAAWVAFWVWLFGRAERSWTKVSYEPVIAPSNVAA